VRVKRPTVWIVGLGAVAIVLIIVVSLFHRIFDVVRGTPLVRVPSVPMDQPPAIADARFVDVLAAVAAAPLSEGHHVDVLVTPREMFGTLFADLRSATRSITFQSYYCLPGAIADSVSTILAERARARVRVLFLADGFGCSEFVDRYRRTLRAAGVELAVLRPVHWYQLHRAQHRSHVRLVVIDGVTGYTGGFGVDDKWADTPKGPGWRESTVRFTGPAVRQLQGAFFTAWSEATRELVAGSEFFRADTSATRAAADTTAAPTSGVLATLQFAGPGLGTTPFERLLFLAIAGARERLYITNPYFVPNRAQRRILISAAARGVDVRVLTAGARTDVVSTRLAARSYYGELLRGRVRIYEYTPAMIHAKTIVADGLLASVGSMNFDNRSMRLNDEVNLLMYERAAAQRLERIFLDDLTKSREVTLEQFARRAWHQRWLEAVVRRVAPLL
jgi:cardiolipin synthase A/B